MIASATFRNIASAAAITVAMLSGTTDARAACRVPDGRDAVQAEMIARVNAFRKTKRRTMVVVSGALSDAAQNHACDMAATGRMSHTGANGSSVGDRVGAEGYVWRFVAENVAAGQRSGPAAFASWKGSRGHRANMLNRNVREIGIGWAIGNGTSYWVMVLAAPR